MEGRSLTRQVAIAIPLLAFAAVALSWISRQPAMKRRPATAAEAAAIHAVIEGAYRLTSEACLYRNHLNLQAYKDSLKNYYSDATRTPEELSTRTAIAKAIFPTPDTIGLATDLAMMKARATADPTQVPDYKLEAWTSYVAPTPDWVASDSMLEERWRSVDTCQSAYGLAASGGMAHAFDVTRFGYQETTVGGDLADVDVLIDSWTEWMPNGDERRASTTRVLFRLENSAGVWKIVNERPIILP